jgi:O-antigen/teichoic acid export membrane protein
VFYFNLFMGAITTALLCVAAPLIADFFGYAELRYLTYAMAFSLFVGAFGSIHSTLLSKEMNFKTAAKVSLGSSVMAGVLAIWMASQGHGVWSLAAHIVVSGTVTVLLLWWLHPWRPAWLHDGGHADRYPLHQSLPDSDRQTVLGSRRWTL